MQQKFENIIIQYNEDKMFNLEVFMKKVLNLLLFVFLFVLFYSCTTPQSSSDGVKDKKTVNRVQGKIIDHNCININAIPESAVINAKNTLHIAYGHTSHGSQIIDGMNGLDTFMGGTGLYIWHDGPASGYLDLDNNFVAGDLGNPDRTTWASRTREYLNNSSNADVNVVIWSWCGQVASRTEDTMRTTYLEPMAQLEEDYPGVTFIYMTGHLNGTGVSGNLNQRNEQIREYCRNNNKWLYDFADIESYDPDGNYYLDRYATDACNYDFDNSGVTSQTGDPAEPTGDDRNWATDWQNVHPGKWYNCGSAHSKPLNANMKAYSAWWLWASIAGW